MVYRNFLFCGLRFCIASIFIFTSTLSLGFYNNSSDYNYDSSDKTISIAEVDEEYRCPLFQENPNEKLLEAIGALSSSMGTIPAACSAERPTLEGLQATNQSISDSVKYILSMTGENEAFIGDNLSTLESNLQTVVNGVNQIGTVLGNNKIVNPNCRNQMLSSGSVMVALNDLVTSITPFALMLAALHPGASIAAKMAVVGGVSLTSSIGMIATMIEQGSYKMDTYEQRKAILQNLCQYTNVARKVRYLQLLQKNEIGEMTNNIRSTVVEYHKTFTNPPSGLQKFLNQKNYVDSSLERHEKTLADNLNSIAAIEQQIRTSGSQNQSAQATYICMLGKDLAKNQNNRTFPRSELEQMDSLLSSLGQQPSVTAKTARGIFSSSIKALQSSKTGTTEECKNTTYTWLKSIKDIHNMNKSLLKELKSKIEQRYKNDKEYTQWKEKTEKYRKQLLVADRVTKVMEKLSKENSAIFRSELDQQMKELRKLLFGGTFSSSPTLSWLKHMDTLFRDSRDEFKDGILHIIKESYAFGTSLGSMNSDLRSMQKNKLIQKEFEERRDFVHLNLEKISLDSIGHENVCRNLESAWKSWSAALNHLESIELVCKLLNPYLENDVQTKILDYCRNSVSYNNQIKKFSIVEQHRADTGNWKLGLYNRAYTDWAQLVSMRMDELQCAKPEAPLWEKKKTTEETEDTTDQQKTEAQ